MEQVVRGGVVTIFKRFLGWSREVRSRVALPQGEFASRGEWHAWRETAFLMGTYAIGVPYTGIAAARFIRGHVRTDTQTGISSTRVRVPLREPGKHLAKGKSARVDRFRRTPGPRVSLLLLNSNHPRIVKCKLKIIFKTSRIDAIIFFIV